MSELERRKEQEAVAEMQEWMMMKQWEQEVEGEGRRQKEDEEEVQQKEKDGVEEAVDVAEARQQQAVW